ncbi:S-formylglutathione hydrolase [Pseudoalteromonas sp. T1lg65]|uniref:S-formylglutathione hydrolase n=1 Tax=Pseudoalteromonas sp. T1lg65 TaxID=2077101 RepID=UPI003F7A2450
MELISSNKVCGGWHKRYTHKSTSTKCDMTFAIFLPESVNQGQNVPVLYWLSGLTCTDENFMQKAGAFKKANELGIAIVAPDTSPRGEDVPDDENGDYDFGIGAGFYVNATQPPYSTHYQMYSYITNELPTLIAQYFPVTNRKSISGHSMGGHGALVIGLRNPEEYQSISAFSPIVNPSNCPWGKKALSRYLSNDSSAWNEYDATALINSYEQVIKRPLRIDQGSSDQFLDEQLQPWVFEQAAAENGYPIQLSMREGYDHSYFFIASFIDEHLEFHASYLS